MGVDKWHRRPLLAGMDRSRRRRGLDVAVVDEGEVGGDVTLRGQAHDLFDVLGVERSERLVSALILGISDDVLLGRR